MNISQVKIKMDVGGRNMNALIKTVVYTFIILCVADTFARNHVEMQTIFYFGMLIAVTYEFLKLKTLEEK